MARTSGWLPVIGLVALSLIPVAAGASRLVDLGSGVETATNVRFMTSPVPVVVHIVSVTVYSLLGAWQFAPTLRRGRRAWHRRAGRVLVPAGILAALSGMWMAVFYALPEGDGPALMVLRLVVGSAMVASIVLGFRAILRRDFSTHSAWMTRGFALGLGAGTQVILLIPGGLIFGFAHELSRTILMGAAWAINLAIAEVVIRRRNRVARPLMRAAVYRRFGEPEVVAIERVARPAVGREDVLIRVVASTVSAADYRARTKIVPAGLGLLTSFALGFVRPRRPILGMEVAGIVESVGSSVSTFRPGDEVGAMLGAKFGGHAEFAVIPANGAIALKPTSVSFADAAALVFGGMTATGFLSGVPMGPGATVLVNGASGAVGTAMVQLAKHRGADVTAVCSAGNADLVRELGADRVIDYENEDFAALGAEWDVIADCVGNAPRLRVAASIARGGVLVLVVAGLRQLVGGSREGLRVVTSGGAPTAEQLREVMSLAESGTLRPVTEASFVFDDVVNAHRLVASGRKRGSVVLLVSDVGHGTEVASRAVGAHR